MFEADDRALLRKAVDGDRTGFVEIMTDPLVRAHLGGPRDRALVEAFLDQVGTAATTSGAHAWVVADPDTDAFLGTVSAERRAAERPGHLREGAEELELSYVLRRAAWGRGVAHAACVGALRDVARTAVDEQVVLVTQTSNARSRRLAARLGFREVAEFEEFGEEQVLAVVDLAAFR